MSKSIVTTEITADGTYPIVIGRTNLLSTEDTTESGNIGLIIGGTFDGAQVDIKIKLSDTVTVALNDAINIDSDTTFVLSTGIGVELVAVVRTAGSGTDILIGTTRIVPS